MQYRFSLPLVAICLLLLFPVPLGPVSVHQVTAVPSSVVFEAEPASNSSFEIGQIVSMNWRVTSEGKMGSYNYSILDNGSIQVPWTLSNAKNIPFSLDYITSDGLHIITMKINFTDADDVVREESYDYWVRVFPAASPEFVYQPPSDITYLEGETGHYLNWTVIDASDINYSIWINNTLDRDRIGWQSGMRLDYNVDGLPFIDGSSKTAYQIRIQFEDSAGHTSTDTVYVYVTDSLNLPISTSKPSLDLSSHIVTGHSESISGIWTCQQAECGFSDGTLTADLRDETSSTVLDLSTSIGTDGSFSLVLDYAGILPGNYSWEFVFSADGFQSQTLHYEVTVKPQTLTLQLVFARTLEQGKDYSIVVLASGDDTVGGSLALDLYGDSQPISGVEVAVTLDYLDVDGSNRSWKDSDQTNSSGLVEFVVTADVTRTIQQVNGIEASGTSPYVSRTAVVVPSESLPQPLTDEPVPGNTPDGQPDDDVNLPLSVDKYIYIGIGVLISFIVLVGGFYITKGVGMDEIQYYQQLKGLRSLLLYNKEGIPLFDVNLGSFTTETTLIAGLSTAITNFLDELSETEEGEMYIMEKEDLFVLSHKLDTSALAVISTLPYSDHFKNNFAEAHKQLRRELPSDLFEKSYSSWDEEIYHNILDIMAQNKLHLRLLYQINIRYSVLRDVIKKDLPKNIKQYYDLLLDLENFVPRPKSLDYWIDLFEEFGITRADALRILMELDKVDLLELNHNLISA